MLTVELERNNPLIWSNKKLAHRFLECEKVRMKVF